MTRYSGVWASIDQNAWVHMQDICVLTGQVLYDILFVLPWHNFSYIVLTKTNHETGSKQKILFYFLARNMVILKLTELKIRP